MTETYVAAGEAPILPAVVTISITRTAFETIAAKLPTGYTAEARPDGKGGYLVTLDRAWLGRELLMMGHDHPGMGMMGHEGMGMMRHGMGAMHRDLDDDSAGDE